ncbi:MAG: type II CAAX endopeptidase family protein [Bacteroidota bacterium]
MNIFWNDREGRIRGGWRIFLFLLTYLLLEGIFFLLLSSIGINMNLGQDNLLAELIIYGVLEMLIVFINLWFIGRLLDKRPFRDYGFGLDKSWWVNLVFGLLLGVILMTITFLIELVLGWIEIVDVYQYNERMPSLPIVLGAFLILFIGVGVSEEMNLRGYLLTNLAESFNFKWLGSHRALVLAWVISSIIFGILHIFNPNASWVSSFNICLAGIVLGLGYVLSGKLSIPIGFHISWNFMQGNIFGFPVSGQDLPSNYGSIFQIQQIGPEHWTGGNFGPEAGLISITIMIIGALTILAWQKITTGSIKLENRIAIYPVEIDLEDKNEKVETVFDSTLENRSSTF